MSKADFKGAAYAVSVWMQQAADDIAAGNATGTIKKHVRAARVVYAKANRWKTHLDRFKLQLLKRRA